MMKVILLYAVVKQWSRVLANLRKGRRLLWRIERGHSSLILVYAVLNFRLAYVSF